MDKDLIIIDDLEKTTNKKYHLNCMKSFIQDNVLVFQVFISLYNRVLKLMPMAI